jgi:hypothetical protein
MDLIGKAKLLFRPSGIDRVFIYKYIKVLIQELYQGVAMPAREPTAKKAISSEN